MIKNNSSKVSEFFAKPILYMDQTNKENDLNCNEYDHKENCLNNVTS